MEGSNNFHSKLYICQDVDFAFVVISLSTRHQSDSTVRIGGGSCFCRQSVIFIARSTALVVTMILFLRSVAISDINISSGSMMMVSSVDRLHSCQYTF